MLNINPFHKIEIIFLFRLAPVSKFYHNDEEKKIKYIFLYSMLVSPFQMSKSRSRPRKEELSGESDLGKMSCNSVTGDSIGHFFKFVCLNYIIVFVYDMTKSVQ